MPIPANARSYPKCGVCGRRTRRDLFSVTRKNQKQSRKWRLALNLPLDGPLPASQNRVCIDHFKKSDSYLTPRAKHRQLRRDAVPCLNLPTSNQDVVATEEIDDHNESVNDSSVTNLELELRPCKVILKDCLKISKDRDTVAKNLAEFDSDGMLHEELEIKHEDEEEEESSDTNFVPIKTEPEPEMVIPKSEIKEEPIESEDHKDDECFEFCGKDCCNFFNETVKPEIKPEPESD